MHTQLLPHDVKKALDLLRSDLAHSWTISDLARRCGVKRRTLEKHFRQFVRRAPLEFLSAERLDQARRRLLAAPPRGERDGHRRRVRAESCRALRQGIPRPPRRKSLRDSPIAPRPAPRPVIAVPPDGIVGTSDTLAAAA